MIKIFHSSRPFEANEAASIQEKINDFTATWSSHNNQLAANGKLLHDRFVVLMVDESRHGASGCSIDKAMHFIQDLGEAYQVDFFNRYLFAYLDGSQVVSVSKNDFVERYHSGKITDDTVVFDTLVANQTDFEGSFLKPLKHSWHRKML
ncbi:MAG: hypothetical protein ACOYOA_06440 [Saprospiraceae bacterium]